MRGAQTPKAHHPIGWQASGRDRNRVPHAAPIVMVLWGSRPVGETVLSGDLRAARAAQRRKTRSRGSGARFLLGQVVFQLAPCRLAHASIDRRDENPVRLLTERLHLLTE